jgi:hypothetical protein
MKIIFFGIQADTRDYSVYRRVAWKIGPTYLIYRRVAGNLGSLLIKYHAQLHLFDKT